LFPLLGIAAVGLRPPYAMPSNGDRWNGTVGDPSIGTETLFRPTRLPLTTTERANARIKDEFGGRYLRVRGHLKAFCHLMFEVVALAADSILRLFSARSYIHPV